MPSPFYRYISILPLSEWPILLDTNRLIDFLIAQPQLRQINAMSFGNAEGQPWLNITMVEARSPSSWWSDDKFRPQFNLVEIVCDGNEPQQSYDDLAARIAEFLQWNVVEEKTL